MEREENIRGDDDSSLENGAVLHACFGAQAAGTQDMPRGSSSLRTSIIPITPRFLDSFHVRNSHMIDIHPSDSLHIVWVTMAHDAIADMPNWRMYTGQAREQVRGDGWLDALHPDDRQRVAQLWAQAMRERAPLQTMYRVRRRDAVYSAFDVRCVPVFRADGSIQEWIWSYIRCLPEQERSALGNATPTTAMDVAGAGDVSRHSVAQHKTPMQTTTLAPFLPLCDAMADAVVVYNLEGRACYFNAAARALLDVAPLVDPAQATAGFTLHDAAGQPFAANRSPVERILHGAALTNADAERVTVAMGSGRIARARLTGTFLRDGAGLPAGAAIILREHYDEPGIDGYGSNGDRRHALGALLSLAEAVIFVSDEATDSQISRAAIKVPRATGQRLAALACDVIGCAHAGILAFDSESDTLTPIAIAGLDNAAERGWWQQFGGEPRFDAVFEPSALGRLRADQVLFIDVRQTPYQERFSLADASTLLAVPMLVGEQLIGILALDYGGATHEHALEEIALAGAVAKLAGLVIERERLLRDRSEAQASVLALREAKRRMDEFLSVASHELRTPLTVIKANIQLLTRRIGQASHMTASAASLMADLRLTPEFLDRTQRQVERLDRLVGDLLDISRIEAGRLTLRAERCDLRAVVSEAVAEQRSTWADRTITLNLPNAAVAVEADVDRIGQVVTNYLTNALKYSQGDQRVVVTMALGEDDVRVAVRDYGPGLTEEQCEQLWERFSRISGIDVQSGSFVGLGLGLYISRTIVERHGGRVGVESEAGEGSTFWFTLPLVEAH